MYYTENYMDASFKKTLLIVIASAAGLVLLFALVLLLFFNGQYNRYQDDQYKFSIKYPKTWKLIKHPQANVAVVFVRPKDTAMDTMQENFNVTVQQVPTSLLSLPTFSAKIKEQMTAVFGSSIQVAEDKPMQWGWRKGHRIVFQAPKPDHLVMVNAWVLKSDQAYILTFLGDMNKYAQDSPWVDEMIRSLELQ
jgi:hypothetical protein